MSFDLAVHGGRHVSVAAWCDEAASLGVALELPPGFDLAAHKRWLPVRIQVLHADAFPRAAAYAAVGPLHAGFKLTQHQLPCDAPAEVVARRLANLEAALAEGDLPALVEMYTEERDALRGGRSVQELSFGVPWHGSEAEFIAMYVAAAAYARAAGGALVDPQSGGSAEGTAIAPLLARLFERRVDNRELERWTGWATAAS